MCACGRRGVLNALLAPPLSNGLVNRRSAACACHDLAFGGGGRSVSRDDGGKRNGPRGRHLYSFDHLSGFIGRFDRIHEAERLDEICRDLILRARRLDVGVEQ